MPQPKTDQVYVDLIGRLAEAGERYSVEVIACKVTEWALTENRKDAPAPRTVRRYVEAHRKLDSHIRAGQAPFEWPSAMEAHSLPWEASRTVLDLVALCERQSGLAKAPSIRQAQWFWRLRVASPTIPIQIARLFAAVLAAKDYADASKLGGITEYRELPLMLAHQPWEGEEKTEAYNVSAKRSGLRPYPEALQMPTTSTEGSQAVYEELLPDPWAKATSAYRTERAARQQAQEGTQ